MQRATVNLLNGCIAKRAVSPQSSVWIRHSLDLSPFLVSTMLKINGDHEESPDDLSAGENASEWDLKAQLCFLINRVTWLQSVSTSMARKYWILKGSNLVRKSRNKNQWQNFDKFKLEISHLLLTVRWHKLPREVMSLKLPGMDTQGWKAFK